VTPGGRQIGVPQHPRQLARPRISLQNLHVTRRHAPAGALRHGQVVVGEGRDLGQMRDDQRLPAARGHPRERSADLAAHFPADALIHLVKDDRRDRVMRREHHLERQHDPGELAP